MLLNYDQIVFFRRILLIFFISMNYACQQSNQQTMGPPTIPIYLSTQGKLLNSEIFLKQLLSDSGGQSLLQYHILLREIELLAQKREIQIDDTLIDYYKEELTGGYDELIGKNHEYATLYAWANRLMQSEIQSQAEVLEQWYKKLFPNHHRWIGTQVRLSPPQAWNDDHYNRYRASFAAWARLKLTQIRHQLIEGADFATLAKKHSHMSDAKQGGIINPIAKDFQLLPSHVQNIALDLRPGEISPPIQDTNGVSIFQYDTVKEHMTLVGEALWIPHSLTEKGAFLKTSTWSSCMSDLQSVLPKIPVPRPNESQRARQRRLKREAKKYQNGQKALEDKLWNQLDVEFFTRCKMQYKTQLPDDLLQGLSWSDQSQIARAPLYQMLAPLQHETGIYIIRIQQRSFLPALAEARLRWIRLDLSKNGIQKYWSSWGLSILSTQIWEAIQKGQSAEIFKHLSLQPETLDMSSLPPDFQNEIKSINKKLPQYLQYKSDQSWIMVHLQKIETVNFVKVKPEILKKLTQKQLSVNKIDEYLQQKWQAIQALLVIGNHSVKLPKHWQNYDLSLLKKPTLP
jgi:hypothetical protein